THYCSGYTPCVLPRNLRLIRLSRRAKPFDSDQFIFESKIDGFRSLAYIENGQCELVSRNGNTFRNFKDLANGSEKTCLWQRFYRSEIVCIDECSGHFSPNTPATMRRLRPTRLGAVAPGLQVQLSEKALNRE